MSDNTFLPRGVREEPVRELARGEARTSHLVFRAADGFEVAIPERVVSRAVAIGESHAPLEWLGQLVGSRYRDGRGHHLLIEAVVRDVDAKREPHFVSSTPASEGRTRALAREQYPDAVVVGWIHGHVRHGARYSRHDFKNQATWTDPDSIGIVVDPWDPVRLAVYRGPTGELLSRVVEDGAGRRDASTRCELAPMPVAKRDPTVPVDRKKRVRRAARSLPLTAAAFAVGVWMGRTEAHVASFEQRQRAVADHGAAPRRGVEATPFVDGPAVCGRGLRASEHPEGAAALQCRDGAALQREWRRNAHPSARMRRSDTPR